ncbi:18089_t:CDS:2, partial [Racocetra persica]
MASASHLSFNHGLIINAEGIQLSDFITYELKPQHEHNFIKNTSFHAKLVNSKTKKETFLFKNHVELSIDDLEYVSQVFDADEAISSVIDLLTDESPTNDIFLTIQCTKAELIIKKESIRPSDELNYKVKEALKHHDPYHKLMDVFNSYGHFLPKKITLGHKIYRTTYLSVDNNSLECNDKDNVVKCASLDDFSESKFENILSRWEKFMNSYNFDLSYFVSINGEFIPKNKLKEWIKFYLESDLDSSQVISCKELFPLYEIFDLHLLQEIEVVLGINKQIKNQPEFNSSKSIKERVLMSGIFITRDDEPIDEITIKFDFLDTCGEFTYKDPKIAWILIGIPAEIGYYSTITRKINVLGFGSE